MRSRAMPFLGGLFLWGLAIFAGAPAAQAQTPPFASVPVYGNWCGPNQPANPALGAPPVDPLDAACMHHDICVTARGPFDCGCDLGLLHELRATRWANPVIADNARAIYDAIALAPCRAPEGMAAKQSMFAADLVLDMIRGRGSPADVPRRWLRLMTGY